MCRRKSGTHFTCLYWYKSTNTDAEGANQLAAVWKTEYKERWAIGGFLKDKTIGSKRLISMPDRISNTINSEGQVLMRPSVISMFNDEGLSSTAGWWKLWTYYMFETQVKRERERERERLQAGGSSGPTTCLKQKSKSLTGNKPNESNYPLYLLYWYKHTNTDAEGNTGQSA